MKKTLFFVPILAILLLLSACGGSESDESPLQVVEQTNTEEPTIESSGGNQIVDTDTEDDMNGDDPMTDADMDEDMSDDNLMADTDTEDDMTSDDPMTDTDMDEDMTGDDQMVEPELEADIAAALAGWQQLPLNDVRTGRTFTLADFQGKTVFVEPMATWCTNCKRQLSNVSTARQQLESDDVVFIGLSLETSISGGDLANYADRAGFDWLFAVMTPELLGQMADEFGLAITNAPSTPHFIIRPDGSFTELVTGIETADELISQIQSAQG